MEWQGGTIEEQTHSDSYYPNQYTTPIPIRKRRETYEGTLQQLSFTVYKGEEKATITKEKRSRIMVLNSKYTK
jgi:hypothetical protein